MDNRANDPDYKPSQWLPVLDVDSLDDETLADTKARLERQGIEIKVKRNRRSGKFTLWRYGGWTSNR